MKIETLSVFPHCYDSVMGESMMRIAQEKGILEFTAHDCVIGPTINIALLTMNRTVADKVLL